MWLITAQSCEDPRAVGWRSSDFQAEHLARLTHRFRLLTDDGEVCFEGMSDGDPHAVNLLDEACLDPLTNFGRGRYGCNRIQYWRRGRWHEA